MSSYIAGENVFATQLIGLLLILSGDLEQNPVPEKEKSHIIFCQWNLNGLMIYNFIEVSLLPTLSVTKYYDVICFIETFLDSSIDNADYRISVPGYNLLRVDYPININRGGTCI